MRTETVCARGACTKRMRFVEVASLSDVRESDGNVRVTVEIDSVPHHVALFYDENEDEVYALSDICTHAGASLSDGGLGRDGTVRCPRHGASFDPRTGEALGYPATEELRTYETKVEDGKVYVSAEDGR